MNTQLVQGRKFTKEAVLVAGSNVVPTNATNDGSNIADQATSTYLIANGQLGFLSKDDATMNILLDSSDFATAKKFTIIQGTGKTSITDQDGHASKERAYIESPVIDKRFPILFDKAYVVNERYGATKLTGFTGTTSLTDLVMNVNQYGVRLQHQNSMEMKDGFSVTYRTPDYATLGTAAANAKNDIYTNLAGKLNLTSVAISAPALRGNQPLVAFVLETSGSTSTQTVNGNPVNCPRLDSIAAGTTTSITFMNTVRNGVVYLSTFPVNVSLREAIAKGIADGTLSGSSRIRVIDRLTALSLNKIDAMLVVALDSPKAQIDDQEPATKTDVVITFPVLSDLTPTVTEICKSYEGQGKGNTWLIRWKNFAKNSLYTSQRYGYTYSFVQLPDYVKVGVNYNVFSLLHGTVEDSFQPKDEFYYATFILVPNMIPLTVSGNGTGAIVWAGTNESGVITSTYIDTAGSGYSGTVTLTAPGYVVTGATFTVTLSGGGVNTVTITNGGSGYQNIAPVGTVATTSSDKVVDGLNSWLAANINATGTEDGATVLFA